MADKEWQDNDSCSAFEPARSLKRATSAERSAESSKRPTSAKTGRPRELRHLFVSNLSDNEVPIEIIADLCRHRSTIVTQKVYRQQLRPVITTKAQRP
jgi:integrase